MQQNLSSFTRQALLMDILRTAVKSLTGKRFIRNALILSRRDLLSNRNIYKVVETNSTMSNEYKSVKFRLSSWKKLRRVFYGRKNETFSDYIERITEVLNDRT